MIDYARAAALDPQRSTLFCNAGGVHRMRLDFDKAADLHHQAIAVRPERTCPCFCLGFIYLNGQGPQAARDFLESMPAGIDLDATPPITYVWWLLDTIDGRYDEALERLNSGPDEINWMQFYYPKAFLRAQVHRLVGRSEDARVAYEDAVKNVQAQLADRPGDSRLHSALGQAYAGLGRRSEAIEEGRRGVTLLPYQKDKWAGPFRLKDMAMIYAMVGETALALDTLDILASIPSMAHLPEIMIDPSWNMLRDEPRFQALGSAN